MMPNTPEWLQMRKGKIGASDAPIIQGVSPWTTPYQLWQQKLGLVPEMAETYPQAEGKRKEPISLKFLCDELGMSLNPITKIHNERSWMMASLDAMNEDGSVIGEIKNPGKEDHEKALAGLIPEKYFPQLQHQMEVCELEVNHYFSCYEESRVLVRVYRDDKYIKSLVKQEEKFYECMQNFEAPALTERDYQEQNNPEWESLAAKWSALSSALHEMEMEEKQIRENLIALCNGQNSSGSGIKVSKCLRKGNVDYSKIPEISKLNLDQYRKKSIEYWKIS